MADENDVVAGIDTWWRAQSNQATAPSMSGLPKGPGRQLVCWNLSGRLEAKSTEVSFWCSERMFTAKPRADSKTSRLAAALPMQISSRAVRWRAK